jgi:Glutamine amidotransferase domain
MNIVTAGSSRAGAAMFALSIWDERRQLLVLARDRVGKKPLNYAVTKTGLAFCSELHPLSRHPGVDNGMDLEALELYLQCQFIPAPWTIYRGIRKLPPAHYAVYDHNGLKIEKYWEIETQQRTGSHLQHRFRGRSLQNCLGRSRPPSAAAPSIIPISSRAMWSTCCPSWPGIMASLMLMTLQCRSSQSRAPLAAT